MMIFYVSSLDVGSRITPSLYAVAIYPLKTPRLAMMQLLLLLICCNLFIYTSQKMSVSISWMISMQDSENFKRPYQKLMISLGGKILMLLSVSEDIV